MPNWTILLGAAIVCVVLVVILLVAQLARRFRHQQRGFPVTPVEPHADDADTRPTGV